MYISFWEGRGEGVYVVFFQQLVNSLKFVAVVGGG
jgi:hypothetical protein